MSASTCERCGCTGYCDLDGICTRCSAAERAERQRKGRAERTVPCRDCGETGHDLTWWNRCAQCQELHNLRGFRDTYGEAQTRRVFGDRLRRLEAAQVTA